MFLRFFKRLFRIRETGLKTNEWVFLKGPNDEQALIFISAQKDIDNVNSLILANWTFGTLAFCSRCSKQAYHDGVCLVCFR